MTHIKTLCKVRVSEVDALEPKLRKLLRRPKYMCRKCLRVCEKKKLLCKPEKL